MTVFVLVALLAQAPTFPVADGCNICRYVPGTPAGTCTLLYCGPATLPVQITLTPVKPESHPGLIHAAVAAHVIAHFADISVTQYAIGTGRYHEANPLLSGWAGGPIQMAIVKGGIAVGTSYLLLRIHKSHPKLTFVLAVASAAGTSYIAARNSRLVNNAVHD